MIARVFPRSKLFVSAAMDVISLMASGPLHAPVCSGLHA
jgi:hypothetical protein